MKTLINKDYKWSSLKRDLVYKTESGRALFYSPARLATSNKRAGSIRVTAEKIYNNKLRFGILKYSFKVPLLATSPKIFEKLKPQVRFFNGKKV